MAVPGSPLGAEFERRFYPFADVVIRLARAEPAERKKAFQEVYGRHLGYVLKDGETSVPAGLEQCLANSNRLQDILLSHMEPGLTGNQILANTLGQMRSEGIDGTVYTHPIGDHGHGAGPLIGRWDGQEGVPVRGDAVLLPSTWHSIELQVTTPIPEWGGKPASCRQEEEAYLDEQGERHWVFRRQSRFHLVW